MDIVKDGNEQSENEDERKTEENRAKIGEYSSMEDFTKAGYKTLMEAIRHSNALPTNTDWSFYRNFSSFKRILNDQSCDILKQINSITQSTDLEKNVYDRALGDKTELVIDVNDVLLERTIMHIDEMNGIKRNNIAPVEIQMVSAHLPINGAWNRNGISSVGSALNSSLSAGEVGGRSLDCIKLVTAKNIGKPQKFFRDTVDNSDAPWQPRITEKPNSIKPLAIFLEEFEDRHEFSHPYNIELERYGPKDDQLKPEKTIKPKPLTETPLIEINSPEQFPALLGALSQSKIIAVDLEHHSYRSFLGITCLMQISTVDTDYLIDTLALRDSVHVLNEIFTNADILKVFHGADNDVLWLQRDLSLYLVNMFDTHIAAKILEYPGLSLAFLLRKFCNKLPNKKFQLADWRIRPLPQDFKDYARDDTHYLIYIYQMMKAELLSGSGSDGRLLRAVLEQSNEICKKRFFKPILDDDSHLALYRRSQKHFDNRQLYALRGIYEWRDRIARAEDESTGYVLPNHMLLRIAETLPREMQGILACCNPIPPLVRTGLLELHQVVLKARDQPIEKPIMQKDTRDRGVANKVAKIDIDNPLHCPHDLSKSSEYRDDMPTLLGNFPDYKIQKNVRVCERTVPEITLSILNSAHSDNLQLEEKKKTQFIRYLSPYERYKLTKPYVQSTTESEITDNQHNQQESANHNKPTPPSQDDSVCIIDTVNANETGRDNVDTEEVVDEEKGDGDNRTDAERINSLRDHFFEISRKFKENEAAAAALEEIKRNKEAEARAQSELGITKKRKRTSSNESDEHDVIVETQQTFENPLMITTGWKSENSFASTKQYNQPNKKKSCTLKEIEFNEKYNNQKIRQAKKEAKKLRKKMKKERMEAANIKPRYNVKRKKKKKIKQENVKVKIEGVSGLSNATPPLLPTMTPTLNQKNIHKRPFNQANQKGVNKKRKNQNFVAFDYSGVDFSRFQGGGESIQSVDGGGQRGEKRNRYNNINRQARPRVWRNHEKSQIFPSTSK